MPNIDDTSVEAMLALCNSHDGCYPMIGFHPTSVDENWKERLGTVENGCARSKFSMVSER